MSKLTDYKPLQRNPNKGTQRGTGILEQSIRELGAGRSILVDKNGVILAGNHAQEAFVNAGIDDVIEVETDGNQVVVVKRTDLDAESSAGKKMAIMDNRTSEQGLAWDAIVVEDLLNEIKQDEGELDAYLESLAKDTGAMIGDEPPEDAGAQIDKAEELRVKWGVELGQLWQLGEHRLICGDCTDAGIIERLMQGEKADVLFTDPPYGVGVVGKQGNIGGDTVNAKAGVYHPVIGDSKPFEPNHLFSLADHLIIWGANYFCLGLPHEGQWLVWDKNRPDGTSFGECELAWTNGNGIAIKKHKCTWDGFHREGESGKRYHPTQKPVKLTVDILDDTEGDIVLDVYLGSGTTLIACERLNRKCRAVEISPAYCAVAIQRWVDMTGQEPVLLDTKPTP